MERELLELFEAANKAADAAASDDVSAGGPEVTRCLDALKQLKSFPVTYDLLASTQVGKKLRHLTKHPKEEIQTTASELIKIWKDIVIEETKSKKGGNLDNKPSTTSNGFVKSKTVDVKVEKSSVVQTVKIEKNGSFSRSESIKVEKKTSNIDTIKIEKIDHGASRSETIKVEKRVSETMKPPPKLGSMVKCNDPVRDKFREILADALAKVSSEAEASIIREVNARDPIRVAVSVESVLFEKLGRSTGNNKSKYRSIMFNLKDSKNPDFRRKVLLGEVTPERLVDMNPEEMASDERQRKNFEIKEKALFECERGQAPEATTDQFKCGRCGQRKTTYYQLQTRSADEPMTTFVTCVNCNNHWKFC